MGRIRAVDHLKDALTSACSPRLQKGKVNQAMNLEGFQFRGRSESFQGVTVAIVCVALLASGGYPMAWAQQSESQVMTTTEEAPKIPNDQLDSLVAPIALYPDALLAQTLAASTYPLEVIQLQQWMDRNKNLTDQALADALEKQNWDPSIQAMAAFPDVVQRLAGNIQWTTDLGNAFLAQQADVMDAIQRMRAKAEGTGSLKTNAQQTVETQTVESGKQVIVIQQANPKVVYVPSYDPVVVYGAPAYPYPSYIYPGYVPGMALAFGAGVALGAAWGGGWGWGWNWGGGYCNTSYKNKYVYNYNKNVNVNVNRPGQLPHGGIGQELPARGQQGGRWEHRPEHRGNAPYPNRGTSDRFRGNAQQLPAAGVGNRPGGGLGAGNVGAGRPSGAGPSTLPAGGGFGTNRPGGGAGTGNIGAGRPSGGVGAGTRPGGGAGVGGGLGNSRPSTLPAGRPSGGGGGDRIGGRSPSGGGGGGAFGGGGMGGASAKDRKSVV